MRKLLGVLLVLALVIGAPAACGAALLASTLGAFTSGCSSTAGAQGDLAVIGDLPAVEGFTTTQLSNAAIVISVARERDLGVQGARIGLITALQESGLRNLANAGKFKYPAATKVMTRAQWDAVRPIVATSVNYPNDGVAAGDWDSIGMFQGRYSISTWSGEGTPEQKITNLLNPTFTSGRFFDALARVNGWEQMRPAAAAQAVQRSAYPDAYDKHWSASGVLVEALTSVQVGSTSGGPCSAPISGDGVSADGWTRPITEHTALSSPYGMRWHPVHHTYRMHHGQDFSAPRGTPIYAAAAGVVLHAGAAGAGTGGLHWVVIDHGGSVVTRYLHPEANDIYVKVGQQVTAGQKIAGVGSSGFSTGPHLHFEVSVGGSTVEPLAFLAQRGVTYARRTRATRHRGRRRCRPGGGALGEVHPTPNGAS